MNKIKSIFKHNYFQFFAQIFFIIIITIPLIFGIGKITHLFDGKDGNSGQDYQPKNPYIENPNPETGTDNSLIFLNRIVSNLQPPTESDLHLDNWFNKKEDKYTETPDKVWPDDDNKWDKNSDNNWAWHLGEIWWPNRPSYDFKIKNYYFNALDKLFIKAKEEWNITSYIFNIEGQLQKELQPKDENNSAINPTNIDLNISNRSVYGLTLTSFTFKLQLKVLDKEFEPQTLMLKFPEGVDVKKQVFTDFIATTRFDNEFAPYFRFNLVGEETFNTDTKLNRSVLDINQNFLARIYSFSEFDDVNLKFLHHAEKYHTAIFPKTKPKGITQSYIFMFNFHSKIKTNDSRGFYLITQIHCNHDKNNGEANPYREDGKWNR